MANVMGEIMADVLSILAITTKETNQGRTSGFMSGVSFPSLKFDQKHFLRSWWEGTDIEDALRKLDRLEQWELRTVTAQVLKAASDLRDGV